MERVRLVRETIGPDAELAIDGNHSFTVREALRFADKVQKYNIACLRNRFTDLIFEAMEN